VKHWCWARETGVTPAAPVPTPAPSVTPAEAERLARQAEATCKAEVARVRCEIELTRIEREETERVEAIERPRKDHEARAAADKAKRDAKALRKKTRREAWWRFWETRRKARQQQHEKEGGQSGTLRVLLAFGIPATLALYFYAHSQAPSGEIFAVGLLTAVAAFAVGALLGFLFGIPRSVAKRSDPADGQNGKTGAAQNATADAAVAASAAQRFAPNTNLEEISDWLTKILVGVGLVQIHNVSGAIEDLADGLAPSLGGDSQGFAVAVTLMVSFSITGFVSAYLYTRLRLQGAAQHGGRCDGAGPEAAQSRGCGPPAAPRTVRGADGGQTGRPLPGLLRRPRPAAQKLARAIGCRRRQGLRGADGRGLQGVDRG
jgi:hypothetical protein